MRAIEFNSHQLNEAGPLLNIAGWFDRRYKNKLNKQGANKTKKFTNEHMNSFMHFMGTQRVDWSTLTMYVMYRYMTLQMELKNSDVVSVVNEVLRDPQSGSKKQNLSLAQIQDINKKFKVSALANGARNSSQKIAEMIIAAASIRQLERHWEQEARLGDDERLNTNKKPSTNNTQPVQNNKTGVSKEAIDKAIALLNQPGGKGKQAALNYLRTLVGEPTNIVTNGNTITANNGKTYKLSIGATGDRIWQNIDDSSDEAEGDVERDLEAKANNLKESINKLRKILESASSGSTASGSIASVANPMGATISRTPNLFGYVPYESPPKSKKRKIRPKSTS